jgi:predicted PurR-regulated permease PerM
MRPLVHHGGLALFGSAGLVLGPVILTITVALVEIRRRRTAGGRAAETGGHGSEEPEHRA